MPDLSSFLRQSSLTYTDIQNDCYKYLESLPEGSKPKDFFYGSEGRIIIDYLSAFHSDDAYKLLVAFCESYLIYANKIEDIIANAESKGYNCKRGSNPSLLIKFIPNSGYHVKYLDYVGSLGDSGLYALESKTFIQGESDTLKVVVGALKESEITVKSSQALVHRFLVANVSDDIRVSIDGNVVNVSTIPINAINGDIVAITNSYGSVDIMDFRSLVNSNREAPIEYPINVGTQIKLEYIELDNVKYDDAIGTFTLGTIESTEQVATYTASESAIAIQKNTILHQQTQGKLIARRDAKKLTKLYIPGMINTNDYDYSPSTVAVTYVLNTGLPMSDTQYNELISYLISCRVMGIPMPYIVPSNKLSIALAVDLTTTAILDSQDIQAKIDKVFDDYEYECGTKLDFAKMEDSIKSLKNVQTARIRPIATVYQANSYIDLGSFILPGNGYAYMATAYLYRTAATEPNWPTKIGETVDDGLLTWETVKYEATQRWEANKNYMLGQTCNPTLANGYSYKVKQIQNLTGLTEPTNEGIDGDIEWALTTYVADAPLWTPSTQIDYGTIVNVSSTDAFSLVAKGFRKQMDVEPPVWNPEANVVESNSIRYARFPLEGQYISRTTKVTLPWNAYAVITQVNS